MTKREIPSKHECPCGSGKRYGKCCKRKEIRWVWDNQGKLIKRLPIREDVGIEILSFIEKQQIKFKSIYGREPKLEDPIFFDVAFTTTDKEFEDGFVRIMQVAGLDESVIYAWKKTGIIVTEDNKQYISDIDIDAWHQAIEEYQNGDGNNPGEYNLLPDGQFSVPIEDFLELLFLEYERCVWVTSLIVSKRGDTPEFDRGIYSGSNAIREYCCFCLARSLHTLKSLGSLIRQNLIGDAQNLIRSLYENYLHMLYVQEQPSRLADLTEAKVGITKGTHEFEKTKPGKVNKRIIVRIADGKRFSNDITPHGMAVNSPFQEDIAIFDFLYRRLSRYTHPNILSISSYQDNGRLSPIYNSIVEAELIHTLIILVFIFERFFVTEEVESDVAQDIATCVSRVRFLLLHYFRNLDSSIFNELYPTAYIERLECLSIPNIPEPNWE